MPARITIKAELQNLLNKAQALTDANRLSQLEGERRRRAEREQLAAKKVKTEEEERRRRALDDPTMRNIRTAAMGQQDGDVVAALLSSGNVPIVSTLEVDALSGATASFVFAPDTYSPRGRTRISSTFTQPTGGEGTPCPGSSVSTTGYSSFVDSHVTSIDLKQSFALPVEEKTCIYCVWIKRLQARSIASITGPYATISSVRTLLPPFEDPRDYIVFSPCASTVTVSATPGTGSVSTEPYTTQTEVVCFLVSTNNIRQIETPAALAEKLEALAPEVEFAPAFLENVGATFDGGFAEQGKNEPTIFFPDITTDSFEHRPPTFFASGSSPFVPIQQNPLSGFGSSPTGSVFTPGVFSLLNNPTLNTDSEVLNANPSTSAGWALLSSKLSGPTPARGLWKCALPGTCTAAKIGFDRLQSPSSDPFLFTRQPSADIGLPPGGVVPTIFAWDWGQPDYCRQQLLALGFSPADLVP